MEAAGQFFVGPDNGIFSILYSREEVRVRALTNDELFRHPVSHTFHGRDIFAPVAAHLAAGTDPSSVGEVIEDYLRSDAWQPVRTGSASGPGRSSRSTISATSLPISTRTLFPTWF